MIINQSDLLKLNPIKQMLTSKIKFNGVSYGLSEAGYDIRLKQNITFDPYIKEITLNDPLSGETDYIEGNFTIASAIEEFTMPNNLVGIVHDKSSWARKGLSVFNTVIEPSWNGFLTLELVYHGNEPLTIKAGSGIAQVIFSEIKNPVNYTGKYQGQEDKPIKAIFEN